MRNLAHYYVHLLSRLGIIRFSLILAVVIVVAVLMIQMSVTFALSGVVSSADILRSVFFSLIVTPWAVFFISIVVEQLDESRLRQTRMIHKLELMRERDQQLNDKLKDNIRLLNSEIDGRTKAQLALQTAMKDLKQEVQSRIEAQKEVEERSVLLHSFINSSPDLVYFCNERGEFSGCNRSLGIVTGRSENELIGLTAFDVFSEDVADLTAAMDKQVFASNQGVTYAQWLTYPDGRKAYFEIRKVPFFSGDGSRLGLLGFGRDITEIKTYQDNLEQVSRDKTEFISTLSHELRTPLNGVVGLSQILLDTSLTSDQRKMLNTIYLSAVTLGNIFNDVIDLDKLDRNRFKVAIAPLNLPALVDDIEYLAQLQLDDKGLNLIVNKPDNLPVWVETDATRLRQIIWNLTSNAAKFTESGDVTVCVRLLALSGTDCRLEFEVKDQGIGIPGPELEKIFAMYYQVKGKRQATGTGIGLAVSQQFAKALGGNLSVSSQVDVGTSFVLDVPMRVCQSAPKELRVDIPALKILLVEDVELNVTVAKAILEKMGHFIIVAMTGEEAIDACEDNDDFDLLLLDMQLPDMTGLELADQLLELHEVLPPMVALTANVVNSMDDYQKHGIVDILRKPISTSAIMTAFSTLFGEVDDVSVDSPQLSEVESSTLLDVDILLEYCGTLGVDLFMSSVDLFEQVIPEYMAELEAHMNANDKDGIVNEAHKIKGAAGSVGLARLQRVANQLQSPELADWPNNYMKWFVELKTEYKSDIQALKNWLEEYSHDNASLLK